jgi:hypothetical protein
MFFLYQKRERDRESKRKKRKPSKLSSSFPLLTQEFVDAIGIWSLFQIFKSPEILSSEISFPSTLRYIKKIADFRAFLLNPHRVNGAQVTQKRFFSFLLLFLGISQEATLSVFHLSYLSTFLPAWNGTEFTQRCLCVANAQQVSQLFLYIFLPGRATLRTPPKLSTPPKSDEIRNWIVVV